MRVLIATPMPPSPEAPGAIPLLLYAQLVGLADRHEITLVTTAGSEPGEKEAVRTLPDLGIKVEVLYRGQPQGIERWKRRWRLGSSWLKGRWPWRTVWFWEPEMQKMLDRLLAERQFDLVSVEDNSMGAYRYKSPIPKVFTEHEVRRPRPVNLQSLYRGLVGMNRSEVFQELDWMRWPSYQRHIWQQFDRIQTFTRRDAAAISRIAPDLSNRVRVNPFGVMLPPPVDPDREIPGRVVFTGNFTHPPNVDAAVWLVNEIMPDLRRLSPGVQLYLVGIYPPREVQDLAHEDIHITGPVEEIRKVLEEASVVVAPIRTGGGMRMKVLHGMAMGKAVVTTPRGSEGLSVSGIERLPIKVAEDTHEFACYTSELLRDPAGRRELGQKARNYVKSYFSPEAVAQRTEAIWTELSRVG